MDFLLETVVIVLFVSLLFERIWSRKRRRLPEEFSRPLLAEAFESWGFGRMSLYDDFLVTRNGTTLKLRVIPYKSIQRVGIGTSPFTQRPANLCIDYTDDQSVARLAQFQCTDGSELLPVLAERLKSVGKGNLVTWRDTHETELNGGVEAD